VGNLLIPTACFAIVNYPWADAAICAMHDTDAITISRQAWASGATMPSSQDYAATAARKSGPLPVLPIRLALIAANALADAAAIRANYASRSPRLPLFAHKALPL